MRTISVLTCSKPITPRATNKQAVTAPCGAAQVNVHTIRDNGPMRLRDYAPRPAHLKWLLDSDPAVRWQVMKDLTDEGPDAIAAERSRTATGGWGAKLL